MRAKFVLQKGPFHMVHTPHGMKKEEGEGDDAAPGLLGTTLQKPDVMFSL